MAIKVQIPKTYSSSSEIFQTSKNKPYDILWEINSHKNNDIRGINERSEAVKVSLTNALLLPDGGDPLFPNLGTPLKQLLYSNIQSDENFLNELKTFINNNISTVSVNSIKINFILDEKTNGQKATVVINYTDMTNNTNNEISII